MLVALVAIAWPAAGMALTATAVAPGYHVGSFPDLPGTNALELSAGGNVYIAFGSSGTTYTIEQLTPPSYTTGTAVSTFTNAGPLGVSSFVTGLDFSPSGQMYASESLADRNSGYIREVATGNVLFSLPAYRPTGIAVVNDNTFLFTGRQQSNLSFGGVYRGVRGGSVVQIIPDIIGRGVAVTKTGDIYVCTPSTPTSAGYLGAALYRFPGGIGPAQWIATFDGNGAEELTLDSTGKVYALGDADPMTGLSPVLVITPPAAPASVPALGSNTLLLALLLLGLAGLGSFLCRRDGDHFGIRRWRGADGAGRVREQRRDLNPAGSAREIDVRQVRLRPDLHGHPVERGK
jgi:hypothetical protein